MLMHSALGHSTQNPRLVSVLHRVEQDANALTIRVTTMVVANWWIKIDAQTTGGLCVATMLLTMWLYRTPPEDIALPLGKKAAKAAAADDVDIISTLASDANPNPGAAKRATKSPKRDKAALRFHE